MNSKKWALIIVLIIIIVLFFSFDIGRYLDFSYIKSKQQWLTDYTHANIVIASLIFFSVYVLITAVSLPGAAVMTLIAGAIFGLIWGTILVSFASVLGATLAFLISRYLFRDFIQQRFGQYLTAINNGVKKEGEFYLLTLRLVPLFPFFMVNSLMALTPIKTINFALVSQLGMLPGTAVFVNAGTQLAKVDAASDILSPTLLFAFLLLGIFPLAAKKLIDLIKRTKHSDA